MQRIQPDSAISPIYLLNYTKEIIIPLNQSQRTELEEYLETILELYTEEEYEDLVEDIVYHYCKRKFDIEREESVKLFYEIVRNQDWGKQTMSDILINQSVAILCDGNNIERSIHEMSNNQRACLLYTSPSPRD